MTDDEERLIDALRRSFIEVFDALKSEDGPWPAARAGLVSGEKAVFILGGANPGVGVLDHVQINSAKGQESLIQAAAVELADEVEEFLSDDDEGPDVLWV